MSNLYEARLDWHANEMLKLAKDEIGLDFLESVLRGLVKIYKDSWGFAHTTFDPAEAHDVCGHIRKAYIEKLLKSQANRYGLTHRTARNKTRNYSHTEVSGETLLITSARSTGPEDMVPRFDYRRRLAQGKQLKFNFADEDGAATEDGSWTYGIIAHAPVRKMLYMPSFARLVFPSYDFTEYLANLDLFELCGWSAAEALNPTAIEETIREEFDLNVLEIAQAASSEEG